jgi:site-specific recombinase XerD
MKPTLSPLAHLLEEFFLDYLPKVRGVSPHTLHAYRDTLRLFLSHVARRCGREVDRLTAQDLLVTHVLTFLESLERERGNSIRTRNCRLVALRCFFKHALRRDPAHADQYARILAVATKKSSQPACVYLEPEEVKLLLDQPDQESFLGMRDYALLLFLYNTGARVSEALDVRLQDLCLEPPRQVRLRGKGQRERIAPLWAQTASALKRLISPETPASAPVFLNQRGRPLTRHGVLRLLCKYSARAAQSQRFPRRPVHPHMLRHSCAVALLQAGVDITVIRDYLGHASIATTNRYVSTNLKMKRDALTAFWKRAGITKPDSKPWKPAAKLLDMLRSL